MTSTNRTVMPALYHASTRVLPLLCLLPILLGFVFVARVSDGEQPLSTFATSLRGRTPGQVHNAKLACRLLNGLVIPPGRSFSFNQHVGPWNRDRGYKKAPVSYGGEMVITWGGGVCQVSSTLYNAALLAGLKVTERDHHVWPATYVPVGRDAAVAYGIADLEIINPFDYPVRLEAKIRDSQMTCALISRTPPEYEYRIIQDRREVIPPTEVVVSHVGNRVRDKRVIIGGKPGYRIRTYRLVLKNDHLIRKELLSDDYYKPLGRVIQMGS